MAIQVKFRSDQPLFKADAIHMPVWLHFPAEVIRATWQYHTAGLKRDNPHKNALLNATFFDPARKAHRLSFWTGREVIQKPKWRRVAVRNFMSWAVIASLVDAGIRSAVWPWVGALLWDMLVWIGLVFLPWLVAHWLWIPVVIAVPVVVSVLAFKALKTSVRRYNRWVWEGGWQRTGESLEVVRQQAIERWKR